MAISKDVWDKAKAYFHLGKTLDYISDKLKINKSTISRKAKKEGWVKGKTQQIKNELVSLERAEAGIKQQKATKKQQIATVFNEYEIKIIEKVVDEEAKVKELIHSTATLAVLRQNELLAKGKKQVMLKVAQYDSEGKRIGEDFEPYEVPLSSSDIKDVVESVDKASITLGVSQRHANSQVTVNTQNNNTQQVAVTKEVVKKVLDEFEAEY